jgi:hypothetical protein
VVGERRIVGWLPLALPVATIAVLLVSAVTLVVAAGAWAEARRLLVAGLETVLPLTIGLATAVVVAGDPGVELQLSLATPYRVTVLRRVVLVTGAGCAAALSATAVLAASGLLPGVSTAGFVLLWAAPVAWFAAAGTVAGAGLGRAAGGGLLSAVWLVQQVGGGLLAARPWTRPLWMFVTTQAGRTPDWVVNRAALLVQAAVLTGAAWVLLRRNDRLLQEATT